MESPSLNITAYRGERERFLQPSSADKGAVKPLHGGFDTDDFTGSYFCVVPSLKKCPERVRCQQLLCLRMFLKGQVQGTSQVFQVTSLLGQVYIFPCKSRSSLWSRVQVLCEVSDILKQVRVQPLVILSHGSSPLGRKSKSGYRSFLASLNRRPEGSSSNKSKSSLGTSPSHSSFMTSPSHKSFQTSPSHSSFWTSPSHSSFRSSPSHSSFWTSPSHSSFRSSPSHSSFRSSPSHSSFRTSPSHSSFWTSPSHQSFRPFNHTSQVKS